MSSFLYSIASLWFHSPLSQICGADCLPTNGFICPRVGFAVCECVSVRGVCLRVFLLFRAIRSYNQKIPGSCLSSCSTIFTTTLSLQCTVKEFPFDKMLTHPPTYATETVQYIVANYKLYSDRKRNAASKGPSGQILDGSESTTNG